jgi:adenylate cyclase
MVAGLIERDRLRDLFGRHVGPDVARLAVEASESLPVVDFGIGVSAGAVFAGNIGAENRDEYTVIGDPVSEAARLADIAKSTPGRTVSSSDAIDRATDDEREYWAMDGAVLLRGRSEPTRISVPRDGQNGDHD